MTPMPAPALPWEGGTYAGGSSEAREEESPDLAGSASGSGSGLAAASAMKTTVAVGEWKGSRWRSEVAGGGELPLSSMANDSDSEEAAAAAASATTASSAAATASAPAAPAPTAAVTAAAATATVVAGAAAGGNGALGPRPDPVEKLLRSVDGGNNQAGDVSVPLWGPDEVITFLCDFRCYPATHPPGLSVRCAAEAEPSLSVI